MIPRAGQYETCVMLVNLQRAVPDVCEQDVAEDQSTWPMGHPMCPHHIRRMEDWAHRRHVDLTEQARERRIEVLVRERAEWFLPSERLLAYIERLADGDQELAS